MAQADDHSSTVSDLPSQLRAMWAAACEAEIKGHATQAELIDATVAIENALIANGAPAPVLLAIALRRLAWAEGGDEAAAEQVGHLVNEALCALARNSQHAWLIRHYAVRHYSA